MRASFRVLTIGVVAAIGASSVAFAQKPSAPPQITPAPIKLPESAIPKISSSVLKQVKPLTPTQKLGLLKTPTSPIPNERNLDTPIRLNIRTPWIDENNYLAVYDAGFNPSFDPPEFDVRGNGSVARVQLRAEPDRTYLVDCSFDPSSMSQFATKVSGTIVSSGVAVPSTSGTTAPPPDRHLTFVIRKDAVARDMVVEIRGQGGNHWYLGTCEITPVRGL